MEKHCDNCYWQGFRNQWCSFEEVKPEELKCDRHKFTCVKCDSNYAEYKYNNEYCCSDCLLTMFGVEEETVTHYTLNGEYLGCDSDMDQVILNLDDSIKTLYDE